MQVFRCSTSCQGTLVSKQEADRKFSGYHPLRKIKLILYRGCACVFIFKGGFSGLPKMFCHVPVPPPNKLDVGSIS